MKSARKKTMAVLITKFAGANPNRRRQWRRHRAATKLQRKFRTDVNQAPRIKVVAGLLPL